MGDRPVRIQGAYPPPSPYIPLGPRPRGLFFWGPLFLWFALFSGSALATTPCPPATVQLLEDGIFLRSLVSLIQKSRQEVWIGAFHFKAGGHPDSPPDQLLNELIRAHERGVNVQVLLEKPEDPRSDLARENDKTATILRKAGVSVFRDRSDRRSHMKVGVVDGRFTVIGSHNLTTSALRYNREISLMVDSPCIGERTVQYLKEVVKETGGRVK